MKSDVTIKQKQHQNNKIALFIRDIIAKNKTRFGIKLPVVIDFVDIPEKVGDIKKVDNKYYYITFGKNETLNVTNPLITKSKSDDSWFEYGIFGAVANKLVDNFPEDKNKRKLSQKYYAELFKKLVTDDVTFAKQDKRLKYNPKEIEYIVSRVKYFKNKMKISKPIIIEARDIGSLRGGSSSSMAYAEQFNDCIFLVLDYNLYNENRGNLIGNKGFDMFIVHELSHIKTPNKYQSHGKEFKAYYKKYASEITKDKDLLNYWSSAHVSTKYMPSKASGIKNMHYMLQYIVK